MSGDEVIGLGMRLGARLHGGFGGAARHPAVARQHRADAAHHIGQLIGAVLAGVEPQERAGLLDRISAGLIATAGDAAGDDVLRWARAQTAPS